jgi:transcriptional regulator with XRE-family HTH domain
MDVGKILGWNVRRIRNERGLSQEQLALAVGIVNQAYVSDLEAGRRNPTAILLVLIARELSASVGDLFETATVPPEHVAGEVIIKSTRSRKSKM